MDLGGRPLHAYYKEGKFERVKEGALCLYCRRVLQNTGMSRLKTHRARCTKLVAIASEETRSELNTTQETSSIELEVPCQAPALPAGATSITRDPKCTTSSEITSSSTLPLTPKLRKRRLDNFVDSVSEKEQAEINLRIAKLVYVHGLDFKFVESSYFKDLVKFLRPACQVISAEDLATKLLLKVYQDIADTRGKVVSSENWVLMIAKCKKPAEMPQTVTANIQTGEGVKIYLDSYGTTEGQDALSLETHILFDAIDKTREVSKENLCCCN
ncbi:uncharacterized protein LOC107043816 [Diachasma alloeum]|uniref:uncharacterized protein LOC107043816 n=1 Tax=Diachasma alloeum TaxID=454923 RepID=UPI0007384C18|nr:uncharacterized protein LOC107043816 [Diachasma alloeum]XP_015120956.1 uncharacterized protein LOC107043816 [Diachasma alloeum]